MHTPSRFVRDLLTSLFMLLVLGVGWLIWFVVDAAWQWWGLWSDVE